MQLPEAFITRTKALLGDEWEAFERALDQERPVSIRFNPKFSGGVSVRSLAAPLVDMTGGATLIDMVGEADVDTMEPVPWASNACYLSSRPVFTLDPLFHAGCYYVQEASSMFLEHFVKNYIHEPVKALDLCAAPGGKATHLSATLPEGSLLVANEVIRSRADILSENLIKWGNPNMIVSGNYPKDMGKLKSFFDLIVCDLPCSGEGMFRKNPKAVSEWSVRNVTFCAERQRQIISDVFPALKPGGILIYSTCTYNREENEDNIEWICNNFDAGLLEEPRRFMPHRTKGEGFFIAALRKSPVEYSVIAGENPQSPDNRKKSRVKRGMTDLQEDYLFLKKSLTIITTGVAFEEIKRKELVPSQALAMSSALPENAFPRWDLDWETALKYLRKEALQNIPTEVPRGFVLVTYRNQPLGFVKNIGNRANNLYPQEWRIRMSF